MERFFPESWRPLTGPLLWVQPSLEVAGPLVQIKLFRSLVNAAAAALLSSLLPIAAGLPVDSNKPQMDNQKPQTPQNIEKEEQGRWDYERRGESREYPCCPQNSAACDSTGYGTQTEELGSRTFFARF